jgi:DNA-binding transcriptional regulator LsrR (DeoR family)
MTLSFDQANTQSRIAPFIGLSRLVVIDGYILNSMTFEGVDINTSKDLTVLNSMQNFFESEFMNEQLNVS